MSKHKVLVIKTVTYYAEVAVDAPTRGEAIARVRTALNLGPDEEHGLVEKFGDDLGDWQFDDTKFEVQS